MSKISSSSPAAAESLALALIHSSRAPVLLVNADLQVVGASKSFCDAFGFYPESMAGCDLGKLGEGEWGLPQLRSMLRTTFDGTASVDAYEMDLVRSDHATARLVLNAHLLDYDDDTALIVLTISDVTSARLTEKIKDDLIKEKQVLLLELQHRVANSLQIIASVLMQSAGAFSRKKPACTCATRITGSCRLQPCRSNSRGPKRPQPSPTRPPPRASTP